MTLFFIGPKPPYPPPNPVPDLYELGPVYVWKDVDWIHPAVRGKETRVTGHGEVTDWCMTHNCYHILQLTDTMIDGEYAHAGEGELVRKETPPGEQLVTDITLGKRTVIKDTEPV